MIQDAARDIEPDRQKIFRKPPLLQGSKILNLGNRSKIRA
jgi:hypothetical protein